MINVKHRLIVRDGVVWDDDSRTSGATAEEYIEQRQNTFTGLYDENGSPLHRLREPIGFNPNRWRNEMANAPSQKSKPVKTKKRGK